MKTVKEQAVRKSPPIVLEFFLFHFLIPEENIYDIDIFYF